MSQVCVIDYGMGNLRSLANALHAVGADVRVAGEPGEAAGIARWILPGVGAFGSAMRCLRERGWVDALHEHRAAGRPFFGICLGFQVLFERGFEHGAHDGLGWIQGDVTRFETQLHVPHVGWNVVRPSRPHAIWAGLPDASHMYFVHSYRPVGVPAAAVLGETAYDGDFVCAVVQGAALGVQFHPEKSGADGLRLLRNFLVWRPQEDA